MLIENRTSVLGKEKPHVLRDNISKEWVAILGSFKGFGQTSDEALHDLKRIMSDDKGFSYSWDD